MTLREYREHYGLENIASEYTRIGLANVTVVPASPLEGADGNLYVFLSSGDWVREDDINVDLVLVPLALS